MPHRELGEGEPVMLLHAFPLGAAQWSAQMEALAAAGWRAVAPELAPGPTVDAMADAVVALADELGLGTFVLGGLSMGGYVTFALLRRHRERVRAVVLADTRAIPDTPEVAQRRTDQMARLASEGIGFLVEGSLGSLPGPFTRAERPEAMARIRALMEAGDAATLAAWLGAMRERPDSVPDLPSLDLPALVIVGDEDPVSPPEEAGAMADALPNARLEVIPRCGHLTNLEDPEAFNAALLGFLADVR